VNELARIIIQENMALAAGKGAAFPVTRGRKRLHLTRVLNAVQKLDIDFGQSVGSRAFTQQRDVSQGGLAIHLLAFSDVRDSLDNPTTTIFGLNLDMAVTPPRYSLRRVKAQQVASRDPVKHAPNLRMRVGMQVCRCSLAPGSSVEIEAQPIALDTAGTTLECLYAAPNAKRAVVHIGAIGEIPDLLPWSAAKASASTSIITAR
jgi:hypothetical protein